MLRACTLIGLAAASSAATYTWNGPALLFDTPVSWVGNGNPAGPTFPAQTVFGSPSTGMTTAELTSTVDVGTQIMFNGDAEITLGENAVIEFDNPNMAPRATAGTSTWITLQQGFFAPRNSGTAAEVGDDAAQFDYNCPLNWLSNGNPVAVPPGGNDPVVVPAGGYFLSTFGQAVQAASLGGFTFSSSPSICQSNPNYMMIPSTATAPASTVNFGGQCLVALGGQAARPTASCGSLRSITLTGELGETITVYLCPDGIANCTGGNSARAVDPNTGQVTIPTVTPHPSIPNELIVGGAADVIEVGPNGPRVIPSTTIAPTMAPTTSAPTPGIASGASDGGGGGGGGDMMLLYIIAIAAFVIIVVVSVVACRRKGAKDVDSRTMTGSVGFENPLYDESNIAANSGEAATYMDLAVGDIPTSDGTGYLDVHADEDAAPAGGYMDVNADSDENAEALYDDEY